MPDEELKVEMPEPEPDKEITLEAGDEVPDPGASEGLAKKSGEDEPPPDHPRFKQVYAKWKDTERELEETKATVKAAQEHNQQLWDKYQKITDKTVESLEKIATPKAEPAPAAPGAIKIADLEKEIDELEAKYNKALEDNLPLAAQLSGQIRQKERQLVRLEVAEAKNAATPKPPKEKKPEEKAPEMPPEIATFIKETEWYGKDPLMTGAANNLDLALSQDPKWQNRAMVDRLAEVKKQVEERFGYKKEGTPPPTPTPKPAASAVEPGNLSGVSPIKSVKLTRDQCRVADMMGIPREKYAKQLAAIGE